MWGKVRMMIDLDGSTIVVTGGCGFIGSDFISMLFEKYSSITVLNIDKMGVGSREFSPSVPKGSKYIFFNLDLSNNYWMNQMGDIFKDVDYLFHFAAESHVDRSIVSPSEFVNNNVNATANILGEVLNHCSSAKVICISTDEVYGHLGVDDPPFKVDSPLDPRSPYSASKAASDLIALSFFKTFGLDVRVTRCCNNFGVYQNDEKFIPTIIRNLINGTKIPVYGNGQNIREWIHVREHNERIVQILQFGRGGEIYNIGTGIEYSNLEIVEKIVDTLTKRGILAGHDTYKDYITFVEDRKGHDFRYALDNSGWTYGIGGSLSWGNSRREVEFEKTINGLADRYLVNLVIELST